MTRRHSFVRLLGATLAVHLAVTASADAQSDITEKLTLHGYITQAFATSTDYGVLGIPTDGTTDYRKVALLMRFAAMDEGDFVLQFGHRRHGDDLAVASYGDVTLDWAFWQQKVAGLTLRAGRVPLPSGIMNETRYVGTLLPFFRAPLAVYPEGWETLDGASVSYTLGRGLPFSVEWTGMYGETEFRVTRYLAADAPPVVGDMQMDRVLGNQVWLNTPIQGVRFGATRKDYRANGFHTGNNGWQDGHSSLLSADINVWKTTIRAETLEEDIAGSIYRGRYVLGTFRVNDHLSLSAEGTRARITAQVPRVGSMEIPLQRERAASVNWAFNPRFMLKLEQRKFEGTMVSEFIPRGAVTPRTNLTILSVSTAF